MSHLHAPVVPDIAEEIVKWVTVLPGTRREKRQLLARLAQAHPIYRNLATRVLFTELTYLDPLFMLLTNCTAIPGVNKYVDDEDEDTQPAMTRRLELDAHAEATRFRLVSRARVMHHVIF